MVHIKYCEGRKKIAYNEINNLKKTKDISKKDWQQIPTNSEMVLHHWLEIILKNDMYNLVGIHYIVSHKIENTRYLKTNP